MNYQLLFWITLLGGGCALAMAVTIIRHLNGLVSAQDITVDRQLAELMELRKYPQMTPEEVELRTNQCQVIAAYQDQEAQFAYWLRANGKQVNTGEGVVKVVLRYLEKLVLMEQAESERQIVWCRDCGVTKVSVLGALCGHCHTARSTHSGSVA